MITGRAVPGHGSITSRHSSELLASVHRAGSPTQVAADALDGGQAALKRGNIAIDCDISIRGDYGSRVVACVINGAHQPIIVRGVAGELAEDRRGCILLSTGAAALVVADTEARCVGARLVVRLAWSSAARQKDNRCGAVCCPVWLVYTSAL
jgi:hypothetical protein